MRQRSKKFHVMAGLLGVVVAPGLLIALKTGPARAATPALRLNLSSKESSDAT